MFGEPNFIGQYTAPVRSIRKGYRSVPLKNAYCEEIELSGFLNGPTPASISFILDFSNKYCEKMSSPSSIWRQDSTSQPLNHELSPITTRPGLRFELKILELTIIESI